jgi:hypothetical protein
MQKRYFAVTIIIVTLSTIIIYPLLPTLAHGQQEQHLFPFSYPTTIAATTKNQTNDDVQSESTASNSFSAHGKNGENIDANVNYNDNVDVNDDANVDINNPSSDSSNNTPKAIILNFYDNDIGQTNTRQI